MLRSLNIAGVAAFYDAIDCLDDIPPCSYIVQEYIPGISLQRMIQCGHRFRMTDVYDILIQTLKILDKLHHHDPVVIHRDIKPSNLMITTNDKGEYKVTVIDFGAVANPQVQGGGSTVAGTFGYMPPEQLMGKPEPASDIYSVGALAVQLFSGKSPADIPVKDFRLIFEPEMQDKPHELVTLLGKMLEPKVEQRFTDIPEIIRLLEEYNRGHFIGTSQDNPEDVYPADYEQKLSRVLYLGQPGSIELWQRLPDGKRAVPMTYKSFWVGMNMPHDQSESKPTQVNPGVIVFLLIIIMFCLAPILIEMIGAFMIILIFAGILAVIGLLVYEYVGSLNAEDLGTQGLELDNQMKDAASLMSFVLHNGRKGMATITSIRYVPVPQKYIHKVSLGPSSLFDVCKRPAFCIEYKFNPPDDRREEDIVHSFVTYTEPENHYKIGDPLPIIYEVEDRFFEDFVYSMPFPVPLVEFENKLIDVSGSLTDLPSADVNQIRSLFNALKDAGDNQRLIKSIINDVSYYTNPLCCILVVKLLIDYSDKECFNIKKVCVKKCYELIYQKRYLKNHVDIYDKPEMTQVCADIKSQLMNGVDNGKISMLSAALCLLHMYENGFDVDDELWHFCLSRYKKRVIDNSVESNNLRNAFYKVILALPDKYFCEFLQNCSGLELNALTGVDGLMDKARFGVDKDKYILNSDDKVYEQSIPNLRFKFADFNEVRNLSLKDYVVYSLVYNVFYNKDVSEKCIRKLSGYFFRVFNAGNVAEVKTLIDASWLMRRRHKSILSQSDLEGSYYSVSGNLVPMGFWYIFCSLFDKKIGKHRQIFRNEILMNAGRLPAAFVENELIGNGNLTSSEEICLYSHLHTDDPYQNKRLAPILRNAMIMSKNPDVIDACKDSLKLMNLEQYIAS